MGKRLRRPSPALVIALVALFVALGGTSYAAFNLPKNSVGAAQLKSGAVTRTKIAKKTIAFLRGKRGATGATGPAGPAGKQGQPGPTGPSSAEGIDAPGTVTFATNPTTVTTLGVSAGSYVVIAHTTIKNDNGHQRTRCALDDSAANQLDAGAASTSIADSGYPNQASLTLMGLLTTGGSTVSIDCSSDRSDTYAFGSKIIAIKVDSVHGVLG